MPQPSLGTYQYRPLDEPDIRLIHLQPGAFDDEIRIRIVHAAPTEPPPPKPPRLSRGELQDTLPPGWRVHETTEHRFLFWNTRDDGLMTPILLFPVTWTHPDPNFDPALYQLPSDENMGARDPPFEALSYVWGSQDDPEIACVESSAGDAIASFPLGRNLASALRHLRRGDKPRTLWIDAICINQRDDIEKAAQVGRMGTLYGIARRVIVWLGPPQVDSALAISTLASLGSRVEITLDGLRFMTPGTKDHAWYGQGVDQPYDDKTWDAIINILGHPWFRRLWTAQEIVVANRLAIVQCGNDQLSWALFRRAIGCLHARREIPRGHTVLTLALAAVSIEPGQPLSQILDQHTHRRCAVPHDKIYGLLALMTPAYSSAIVPNYRQPVSDVFRDIFLANCRTTFRWEIFGCPAVFRQIDAPTWVPDFIPFGVEGHRSVDQFAAGHSRLHMFFEEPHFLQVVGVQCGSISGVGGYAALSSGDPQPVLETVRSWIPPDLDTLGPAASRVKEAFALMLAQGCFQERHLNNRWPTFREWMRYCEEKVFSRNKPLSFARSDPLDNHLIQRAEGRLLFTGNGFLGLGPKGCRAGDVVCVVLGCDRPLVLRPIRPGNYHLLGHCFVEALQDARALLGPLPYPWCVRVRPHPELLSRSQFHFLNPHTRSLVDEDPRLGPLVGWERIPPEKLGRLLTGDDPEVCDFFKNTETGEIINSDPRLESRALKARGVALQMMTIH